MANEIRITEADYQPIIDKLLEAQRINGALLAALKDAEQVLWETWPSSGALATVRDAIALAEAA